MSNTGPKAAKASAAKAKANPAEPKKTKKEAKRAKKKQLANLPLLSFSGSVHFVKTPQEDLEACEYLLSKKEKYVGVDFEWQPDIGKDVNNPLAIAQVCCDDRCYIWCLFLFKSPPTHLHQLLKNPEITKAGCGMTNDFRKLQVSGLSVPTRDVKIDPNIVDIAKFKMNPQSKALDTLCMHFIGYRLDKNVIDWFTVQWSTIMTDEKLRFYAVLDAYATYRVHQAQLATTRQDEAHHQEVAKLAIEGEVEPSHDRPKFEDFLAYRDQFAPGVLDELDTQKTDCETRVHRVRFERQYDRSIHMIPCGDSESEHFKSGFSLLLYVYPVFGTEAILRFGVSFDEETGIHTCLDEFDHYKEIDTNEVYYMKQIFNPTSYLRMLGALDKWHLGTNETIQKIILGSTQVVPASLFQTLPALPNVIKGHALNNSQLEAVKFSIQRPFSMIHGPPGTGKTHTLAAIANSLVNYGKKEQKILVCAPSNEASDNLAEMILQSGISGLDQLLIVKSFMKQRQRSRATLKKYMLHEQVPPYRTDSRAERDQIELARKERVSACRIVVCTLSMAGGRTLVDQKFHYVLVDEASQCVEAETLIAVAHGCQNLTLAGDHKQLRPVVMTSRLKNTAYDTSLFERLVMTQQSNSVMLNVQYRMHPSISAWPSKYFYDGKLIDGVTELERTLKPTFSSLFPKTAGAKNSQPNVLIHVPNSETSTSIQGSSFYNVPEAQLAAGIYAHFRRQFAPNISVVILTPYTGQVQTIERTLRSDASLHGLIDKRFVFSITEFQGREADIIIVSTVRSVRVAKGVTVTLGFTAEPQRTNVALTRAKRAQVVLGDLSLLQTNSIWKSAIEHYHSSGSVFVPTTTPAGERIPTFEPLDPSTIRPFVHPAKDNATASNASSSTGKPRHNENAVFVGNLPFLAEETLLLHFFRNFPPKSIHIPRRGKRSLGYAFMEYATPEEQQAVLALTGLEIGGRAINLQVVNNDDGPREGAGTSSSSSTAANGTKSKKKKNEKQQQQQQRNSSYYSSAHHASSSSSSSSPSANHHDHASSSAPAAPGPAKPKRKPRHRPPTQQ